MWVYNTGLFFTDGSCHNWGAWGMLPQGIFQFYETAGLEAIINNVTGSEKRDYFVLFPNFHFKTLISLEP